VAFLDYEYASQLSLAAAATTLWMPDLLEGVTLKRWTRRVARFFPGLKENLYLDEWRFSRDDTRRDLAVDDAAYLVVSRPPAVTAHYASERSWPVWVRAMNLLLEHTSVHVLVSPRSRHQAEEVNRAFSGNARCVVMKDVAPGPSHVAAADLVLGGGGTMNREAAVLGVPVWSVFTGPPPHIDECLAEEGRLRWLREDEDFRAVEAMPLPTRLPGRGPYPQGLQMIRDGIAEMLGSRDGFR